MLAGLAVGLALLLRGPPKKELVGPASSTSAADQQGARTMTLVQSPLSTPAEEAEAVRLPSPAPSVDIPFQSLLPMPRGTAPPTITACPTPPEPAVPTPLPTPVVTAIPVAEPPFIPGVVGKSTEPYQVIVRQDNTVWTMDHNGGNKRKLVDTERELSLLLGYNPLPQPRIGWGSAALYGDKLALVLSKPAQTKEEALSLRHHIFLLDVDTGDCSLLAQDGMEPVWSPDGQRIAYQGPDHGLWIADTATRTTREVFPVEKDHEATAFAWSPDGQKIAFVDKGASLGGIPEMLVVPADGNGEAVPVIPPTGWYFGDPTWFPDGEGISYVHAATEPTAQTFFDLWAMDSDGNNPRQLTTQSAVSHFASQPPDGNWIAFSGKYPYEGETSPPDDLWLVNAGSGELVRLTSDSVSDSDPRWSPDGTHIVFRRARLGVWAISLSDGDLRQIYPENVDFAVTRWPRDGG